MSVLTGTDLMAFNAVKVGNTFRVSGQRDKQVVTGWIAGIGWLAQGTKTKRITKPHDTEEAAVQSARKGRWEKET